MSKRLTGGYVIGVPALLDPYFDNVSLLLHMDGSNGSTTFTDSSSNRLTVAANGGASISTSESKYGNGSAYFNGTSDSLSFADPALGTGNFTIEMWFKTTSSVQYAQLIGNENSGYSLLLNNSGSTAGDIALYNGSLVCASSGTSYRDNAWHHLAVTRQGTSVTIWLDGTSIATGTSSASFSGQTNYIAKNNAFGPRNFVGYIDDIRITKSICRYNSNSNFTPATSAFPSTSTVSLTSSGIWSAEQQQLRRNSETWPISFDPYFNNVSLLLHMDGSNGSTTFIDSSSNALTVTANGNAQISTTQGKFGGASALFDGSGDYLTVANSSVLTLGSSNFTIEMWIRPVDLNYRFILGATVNSGSYLMLAINPTSSGQIWMGRSGTDWPLQFSGHSLSTNTWAHLAITRSGSTNRLFIDGIQIGSSITDSTSWSADSAGMLVGYQSGGSAWNGYIDDLRITKGGVARYTSNFTPNSAPFFSPEPSGGSGSGADPYFNNVSLLLHMDGSNGSTTFTDSSSNALTVTAHGNAQISTEQSKFGNSSAYFDGSGDFLTAIVSGGLGAGDFTIEMFFYQLGNALFLFNNRTNGDGGDGFDILYWGRISTDGAFIINSEPQYSRNTWNHYAISRSSNTFNVFLNGTLVASTSNNTNFSGSMFYLFGNNTPNGNTGYFNGYIDQLRITKGVARYNSNSNFTPPTSAFPNY